MKDQTEKKITYKQFVCLLLNLAIIKFLNADPAKVNTEDWNAYNFDGATLYDPLQDTFMFANLKGVSGLVVKFIFTYISKSVEYKKCVTSLKNKSAVALSNQYILDNIITIQQFYRNLLVKRKLTNDLKVLQQIKKSKRESLASNILQKLVRGFMGRRRIIRYAQETYQKYIDGETDQPYWFVTIIILK